MRTRTLLAIGCVLVIAGCDGKLDDAHGGGAHDAAVDGSPDHPGSGGRAGSHAGTGGRAGGSAGTMHAKDGGAGDGSGGSSGTSAGHDAGGGQGGTSHDAGPGSHSDAGGNTGDKVSIFVAQGQQGRLTISCDDGHTWINDHSDDDSFRCWSAGSDCDHSAGAGRGLAYGNGVFTATFGWGDPGYIGRSTNGIDWEQIPQTLTWADIAFGDGAFVACGPTPLLSNDGKTWTEGGAIGLSVGNVRGIGFGNGSFIITGESGSARDIAVSTDAGKNWKPPTTRPDECVTNILGSAASDDVTIFAGGTYVCRTTDGGDTWTSVQVAQSTLSSNPIWTGSEFMVWQYNTLWRSPDGTTWTSAASNARVGPVARSKSGTFVTVDRDTAYDTQKFYRSEDGVNWEALDSSAFKGSHPINFIEAGEVDPSADCPAP